MNKNKKEKLKVFTVCAGVGTGEFGLKRLNIPFDVVGYSEINKKAIQCYEQNHKGKNFGDITLVKPKDVPEHDYFMAGFPCQAFSLAGKRMGTDDIRGQVIYYILEILKEKRPEHVLLENVRGLLSWNNGELFNFIIRELKKMYSTVQHSILNSKDYGVPQNRERIFIYATNREVPFGWNFIPKKQELKLKLKDMLEDNPQGYDLSEKQLEYALQHKKKKGGSLSINKDVCGCLTKDNPKRHIHDSALITVNPIGEPIQNSAEIGEPIQNSAEIGEPIQNSAEIGEAKRIYSEKGLAPCVKKSNIIVHSKQPRTSKTGKGGTGHLCKDGETSYCLDKGNSQYIEYQNNIRILTPLECFRLQGFKDNEINLDNLSDTAKYELAGNGWTLTVVEEIERKIFNYILTN